MPSGKVVFQFVEETMREGREKGTKIECVTIL